MRILLVVAYFVPEIGSAAHVYFDLARAFVAQGHHVDVITSCPRKFNLDVHDVGGRFPLEETVDGIHIHRCKHTTLRDSKVLRGFEHFQLARYYFKTYKILGKKFDVCLMYVPPLPLYYLARKIKLYDGTPSVLNFQDFHPQELTDVGFLKNPLMIRLLKHIEREAYKNADYITVLSEQGVDYIIERGGDRNKIAHIYNGVDLQTTTEFSVKPCFKTREGIEDKSLISYAGILSPFQGVDAILDAAETLKDQRDFAFYIIGDGMAREHLIRQIQTKRIPNVKILPLQPRGEYLNIVSSSDISIVSLDKRMMAPCLPGKLLNLLCLKQPVLGVVPLESQTASFIKQVNCGVIVDPEDFQDLAAAILDLKSDPKLMKELGENGRRFIEKEMNVRNSVLKYERIFSNLCH